MLRITVHLRSNWEAFNLSAYCPRTINFTNLRVNLKECSLFLTKALFFFLNPVTFICFRIIAKIFWKNTNGLCIMYWLSPLSEHDFMPLAARVWLECLPRISKYILKVTLIILQSSNSESVHCFTAGDLF